MADAKINVDLIPRTQKVEAALRKIQAQAKGVDFGGGVRSIDKLSRPLGRITGQANEFTKSLEASNARVLAFGASVAVINKLSDAFSALVSNTIKIEAAFTKIGTILGGTTQDLQKFGDGIFQVAQRTGNSFDQVAEGALELARQGLSVEESLSRVETALKLVRVAGIDSQKAVGGLTAAIKNFEGAGLTVAQIADKIAEVDTQFATSTDALIDGLKRASASAQVAGVSFDELLSVITVVEERTQRGGAVIGNAFKTIFARVRRTDTLDALKRAGIEVLDAAGNIRGAVPIFQDLAFAVEDLGFKSDEAAKLIEKVAGVRQGDILINLLRDLVKEESEFARSLNAAGTAFGSLDKKNNAYLKTLDATINKLGVAAQKLSFVIGEEGFADAAKNIINIFEGVVTNITDLLQGDTVGSKFAKGIVKGIGNVLTGPGIALIGAVFIKLFRDLTVFGLDSLKAILGINKATQQQAALQQSVLQTLLSNEAIQAQILKLEGDKVAQEQLLLQVYNQQAAALQRIQKIAGTVTPGLFGAGFRGGAEGVTKGRSAGGYVAGEARDVSRGVGGATPGSKVVAIPNFAFGGGQKGTMIANSSEYYVPNYAGGGDAIFNQNMAKAMGVPSGAQKIRAAGGFIPNFATRGTSSYYYNLSRKDPSKLSQEEKKDLRAYNAKKGSTMYMNAGGKVGVASLFQGGGKTKTSTSVLSKTEQAIIKKKFPNSNVKKVSLDGIQVKSINDLEKNLKQQRGDRNTISKLFAGPTYDYGAGLLDFFSSDERSNTLGAMRKRSKGPNLFSASVLGGIFESAIKLVTGGAKAIPDFDSAAQDQTPFDFEEGGPATKRFKSRFGFSSGLIKADAKRSATGEAVRSLIGKSIRDPAVFASLNPIVAAAGGFIPNFADPLTEAIEREKQAGVPINQIRLNQSGKLRNAGNPMGLAVTNTRDEPTGAIPNYAKGDRSGGNIGEGAAFGVIIAAQALQGLTSGFVEADSALQKLITGVANGATVFATFSLLSGPVEGLSRKLQDFGRNLVPFGPQLPGVQSAKRTVGGGIAGLGSALPGIVGGLGIAAAVAPLIIELTKAKEKFADLNASLATVKLSELAAGSEQATKALKDAFVAELKRRESLEGIVGEEEFDRTKGDETRLAESIFRGIQTTQGFTFEGAGSSADRVSLAKAFEADRDLVTRILKDSQEFRAVSTTGTGPGGLGAQIVDKAFVDLEVVITKVQQAFLEEEKLRNEAVRKAQARIATGETISTDASRRLIGSAANQQNFQSSLQNVRNIGANTLKQLGFVSSGQGEDAKLGKFQGAVSGDKSVELKISQDLLDIDQKRTTLQTNFKQGVIDIALEENKINDVTEKQQAALEALVKDKNGHKDIELEIARILDTETDLTGKLSANGEALLGSIQKQTVEKQKTLQANEQTLQIEEESVQQTRLKLEAQQRLLQIQHQYNLSLATEKDKFNDTVRAMERAASERNAMFGLMETDGGLSNQQKRDIEYARQKSQLDIEEAKAGAKIKSIEAEISTLRERGTDEALRQVEFEKISLQNAKDDEASLIRRNQLIDAGNQKLKDRTKFEQAQIDLKDSIADMTEQVPVDLQNNLVNGLSNAFNRVANEGVGSLGDALLDVAADFGRAIQRALMDKAAKQIVNSIGSTGFFEGIGEALGFATGGPVKGGSGIRDDVPAMLTGGEYVIRKAAVNKYGMNFLDRLNNGGVAGYNEGGFVQGAGNYNGKFWEDAAGNQIGGARSNERLAKARAMDLFLPGTAGAGAIEGKESLLAFATQSVTSGSTDLIGETGINLEQQSRRLSTLARFRDTPERRALKEGQKQALNAFYQQIGAERRVVEENRLAKEARDERRRQGRKAAVVSGITSAIGQGLQNVSEGGTFFGDTYEGGKLQSNVVTPEGGVVEQGTSLRNIEGATQTVSESRGKFLGFQLPDRNVIRRTDFGESLYQQSLIGGDNGLGRMNLDLSSPSFGFEFAGDQVVEQMQSQAGAFGIGDSTKRQSIVNQNFDRSSLQQQGEIEFLLNNPIYDDGNSLFNTQERLGGGYANGGPSNGRNAAMLMDGEYVVGSDAAARLGRDFLDDINSMTLPKFANGGAVGSVPNSSPSGGNGSAVGAVNITVNVDKSGSSQESENNTTDSMEQDKELARKIKNAVVNVINEEKRVSGSLFTRSK